MWWQFLSGEIEGDATMRDHYHAPKILEMIYQTNCTLSRLFCAWNKSNATF